MKLRAFDQADMTKYAETMLSINADSRELTETRRDRETLWSKQRTWKLRLVDQISTLTSSLWVYIDDCYTGLCGGRSGGMEYCCWSLWLLGMAGSSTHLGMSKRKKSRAMTAFQLRARNIRILSQKPAAFTSSSATSVSRPSIGTCPASISTTSTSAPSSFALLMIRSCTSGRMILSCFVCM